MRLWHQKLIHHLPTKQLLGQHRECCALRGKGWGKKHSVVDYVFEHPYSWLFYYHHLVMEEMSKRGYRVTYDWKVENYRGKQLKYTNPSDLFVLQDFQWHSTASKDPRFKWFWETVDNSLKNCRAPSIYPEHDNEYLVECLENLEKKNAQLVNGTSIAEMRMRLAIEEGV